MTIVEKMLLEERVADLEKRVKKLEGSSGGDTPVIRWQYCNNYQAGRYAKVDTIVYHYTAGTSDAEAIVRYWNKLRPPNRVSAHYIIDRDGRMTRCVEEKDTAWHAWKWNPQSIGIEIVAVGSQTMTPEQQSSLAWLTKDIMTRNEIKKITGHRFLGVATSCPGQVFPDEESIRSFLWDWGIKV